MAKVGAIVQMYLDPRGPILVHEAPSSAKLDLGTFDQYELMDWDRLTIEPTIRACEVPRPGIVLAIRRGDLSTHPHFPADIWVRTEVERIPQVAQFLRGLAAQYEPSPPARFDVFVSCSSKDLDLATEFDGLLQSEGLTRFLASESIAAGTIWTDEIRNALRDSRVVLLLITADALTSQWVMCEAGAFWAFGKPIYPAFLGVAETTALPDPIRQYQGRRIETSAARAKLVKEIKARVTE